MAQTKLSNVTLNMVYLALSKSMFPQRIEFKYAETLANSTCSTEILLVILIKLISINQAKTETINRIMPLPYTILVRLI